MRRLVPIATLLGLAGLAAVALARVDSAPAERASAVAATGSFQISNSRDGAPIFATRNLAPGASADGTVTIENTGTEPARLVLHRGEVVDSPGLGGSVLSERLRLSVVDITGPSPRTLYAGPLATMPDQAVGELSPGEARTFKFTATLPETGEPSLENAVQGASTTVSYAWSAEAAGGGETPGRGGETPAGGPPPAAPGGGAGAVAGQRAVLNLKVLRVGRAPRHGRLIVWTDCDRRCRLAVRGHIRARAAGRHRGARVRLAQRHFVAAGPHRLRIPIPPKLRRLLRRASPPKRLRVKLRFIAVGTDGQRDVVRRNARLRAGRR
jgi:hypothetical protein